MRSKQSILVILVVAVSAYVALAASFPSYVFTQAGVYPGAYQTFPDGANLTQIVGYYDQPGGGQFGYIETGGTFITAQPIGSIDSYLFSINANGIAVGSFCPPGSQGFCTGLFAAHGYAYDVATGAATLIDYPGAKTTAAFGINDSGVIVGGFCVLGPAGCAPKHAFRDDNGVFTQLDFPGGEKTTAFGINNAGTIVGTYTIGSITHGFIYQNGTYTDLSYPGAYETFATGINNAGVVVGNYEPTYPLVFGFMYYNGQWAQISVGPSGYTGISGINDRNDIVGTWTTIDAIHPIVGVPKKSMPALVQ